MKLVSGLGIVAKIITDHLDCLFIATYNAGDVPNKSRIRPMARAVEYVNNVLLYAYDKLGGK